MTGHLLDDDHVHHPAAERWLATHRPSGWATCPLTQDAAMRIMGRPSYSGVFGSPFAIAVALRKVVAAPDHVFWPDDISLLDPGLVALDRLTGHQQLSDTYLLALDVARSGASATFDRGIDPGAVSGGSTALHLISTTAA